MFGDDNACTIAAFIVDDIDIGQIETAVIACADRARGRAGQAAARKNVLFTGGNVGLLPCKAAVVKDERTVLVHVIVAGRLRAVAVGDREGRGFCVLTADSEIDEAALRAFGQRERMAIQAERHLYTALRHAQRLSKRQIVRQVIASGFQFTAGRFQREKCRLFTGVFLVDGVDVRFTILRGGGFHRVCVRLAAAVCLGIGSVSTFISSCFGRRFFFGLHGFRRIGGSLFLCICGGSKNAAGRDQKRQNERQTDPSLFHGCSSFFIWNILCLPKV